MAPWETPQQKGAEEGYPPYIQSEPLKCALNHNKTGPLRPNKSSVSLLDWAVCSLFLTAWCVRTSSSRQLRCQGALESSWWERWAGGPERVSGGTEREQWNPLSLTSRWTEKVSDRRPEPQTHSGFIFYDGEQNQGWLWTFVDLWFQVWLPKERSLRNKQEDWLSPKTWWVTGLDPKFLQWLKMWLINFPVTSCGHSSANPLTASSKASFSFRGLPSSLILESICGTVTVASAILCCACYCVIRTVSSFVHALRNILLD